MANGEWGAGGTERLMPVKRIILIVTVAALLVAALILGPLLAHHLLPHRWTGESRRLAEVLGAKQGDRIAEIGAGSGRLAREIARIVGPTGRLYATEIEADLRQDIAAMAGREGLAHLEVVEARPSSTNLTDACCRAIYMRLVLHHIDDWPVYATDLRRTLQPGGILAIIDFAPGAMFFLPRDHGASPDEVVRVFADAGFVLERRIDDWGGATYLVAFRRPS